jgi:selenobiotic family peptide radical SAM maturase
MLRDRWFLGRAARDFTLQWHLTNACPFHCRHCYDRSDRRELPLEEARRVVADLRAFCRARRVSPQISLSGGDPLLCSYFWTLYEEIAAAEIPVSILGNPIGPENIEQLLRIRRPTYYQVSLEGLRAHNDAIRGTGHFDLVMAFLAAAWRRGLPTHVMLTLTRANLDQVAPLATELRGLTARFTFNRLAQVGEAENMALPDRSEYVAFLKSYLHARRVNPVLGVKDNLLSILPFRAGGRPFRGCTGFGCGAAFNFVALLPDGEVHACRKFPSLLGNIRQSGLAAIYDSEAARRYRAGSEACRRCRLRRCCGGCLAVSYGQGLAPLEARDPHCFID